MVEELRLALQCYGSRQRPTLNQSCTKCSPGTTYVPGALNMSHLNGVQYNLGLMLGLKLYSFFFLGAI